MRLLKKSMKFGKVKVKTDSLDDLWHLEKIIEPGDLVTSKTFRKTAVKRGSEIVEGERKPAVLTIKVEKINRELNMLKLIGPIVSAPEDFQKSAYHSLQIGTDTVLVIKKEKWQKYQLDRLEKARVKTLLLVCVLDREEANFAELRDYGIELTANVYAKKMAKKIGKQEAGEKYYEEILGVLERNEKAFQKIIIAGPGFERENLFAFIKKNNETLARKIVLEHSNEIGLPGIQEVLKKSGDKVLRETRVAKETQLVESLLIEISRQGLGVYGREEAEKAVNAGAVEILLVSEEKVKEKEFEPLMNMVERLNGKVVIIAGEHEAGERFLHIGGIGGFLRFKVSY